MSVEHVPLTVKVAVDIACFVESKPITEICKDVSIQTNGWSNKGSRYPAPRLNIPTWQVIEQKGGSILLSAEYWLISEECETCDAMDLGANH